MVGVNLQRGPDGQRPWAPARSAVVELDAGELRTLPPIVVRRLVQVRVRGVVRFADDRPAPNQRVAAHAVADLGPPSFKGSSVTDAEGAFEMELFHGQSYTFSTSVGSVRHESRAAIAGKEAPVIVIPTR